MICIKYCICATLTHWPQYIGLIKLKTNLYNLSWGLTTFNGKRAKRVVLSTGQLTQFCKNHQFATNSVTPKMVSRTNATLKYRTVRLNSCPKSVTWTCRRHRSRWHLFHTLTSPPSWSPTLQSITVLQLESCHGRLPVGLRVCKCACESGFA